MAISSSCKTVFLKLVSAGLWETEAKLASFDEIDYKEIFRLALEQSVIGLVAAGMEQVTDVKLPQKYALLFAGETLRLEQRNKAMNVYIADLVEDMRSVNIYTLLVKGQGLAQCYERPLWRASGDIDFLLSEDNYKKAATFLSKIASYSDVEHYDTLHKAFIIDSWEVELHGTLHSKLWRCIDKVIDQVQTDVFCGGAVRTWMNGHTQVFLPRADEDVIFVFSHILQHFFNGGVGLRQICDWCRLLWTYRSTIDNDLLLLRLQNMGTMSEWKTFAALAVDYLGMPEEAVPFYSHSSKWKKKAKMVLSFIFETGNMGHNKDVSYRDNSSKVVRKLITFYRVTFDSFRQMFIFPKDAFRAWWRIMVKGVKDSI